MKSILNVRIEQEFKEKIELLAEEEGISPSELTRNILYEYLEELPPKYDPSEITVHTVYLEPIIDVRKDVTLISLWLFVCLSTYGYCNEANLMTAKDMLERLTKSKELSNELRFEFLKVLNDINRVLMEGVGYSQLCFMYPNNMYTINYTLVFAEVYNLINSSDDKGGL